jgi:rhodanese-related sulfurtransferase
MSQWTEPSTRTSIAPTPSPQAATESSLSSRIRGRPHNAASLSDRLVDRARRHFQRVTAEQAAAELVCGALLVDIRSSEQRRCDGEIHGALAIDRTVLEWRLDPTSPSRIAEAKSSDVRVIVICAEGYSSSLAAASLRELGLLNATDVIDGVEGWKAAGLPLQR